MKNMCIKNNVPYEPAGPNETTFKQKRRFNAMNNLIYAKIHVTNSSTTCKNVPEICKPLQNKAIKGTRMKFAKNGNISKFSKQYKVPRKQNYPMIAIK